MKRLSVLDKYEHILSQVNMVAMERLIDPKTQVNIQLVCEDPATLAQQLTHIELVSNHPFCLPESVFRGWEELHDALFPHFLFSRRD